MNGTTSRVILSGSLCVSLGRIKDIGNGLRVKFGTSNGLGLKFCFDGKVIRPTEHGVSFLEVGTWERAAVYTYEKATGKARMFKISPSDKDGSVGTGEFSVTGRFEIMLRVNHADKATKAFNEIARAGESLTLADLVKRRA